MTGLIFQRLSNENLDRFERVAERLIAQFLPEEKQAALLALADFKTARRKNHPCLAAQRKLSAILKRGALKIVVGGGGWDGAPK